MQSLSHFRLSARDGYALGAVLYEPPPGIEPARAAVLCSGGGVPARIYRHLAAWLALRGMAMLCFDYRGIGRSRPESLRGFHASLEDWAEHDCAAAIDWLRERFPRARLAGIAHSIGGLILAGAPNSDRLERFLLVGPHTGYCGDYHPRWRVPMTLWWHRLMPALVSLVGYFPGRALRVGENLPARFARQWASRRTPQFQAGDERAAAGLARCRALRGRALALTFTDDGFATVQGARRVLELLPQLAVEHRVISPADAGLRRIGHFGFFCAATAGRALWSPAAQWLLAAG